MGVAVLSVSAIREELAAALTGAGVKAYADAPKAFNAPGAVIDLDEDFITFDGTMASVTMHFNIYVLTNPSPTWENEVTAMVGKTLGAYAGTGVGIEGISLYDTVQINSNTRVFRGAVIKIAVNVPLKEMS